MKKSIIFCIMEIPQIAFLLALILAMVHSFSEEYGPHVEKFHVHTISFSAGLFLGIIFLNLLPELFIGTKAIGQSIYLLMLAGFVLFHVGEKYIYQHVKNKNKQLKDLAAIHALGFFINHFVIGVTLFLAFSYKSIVTGFLIFIPLLLHTFSSSISLNHLDRHFSRKSALGVILPFSPMIGVVVAFLLNMNSVLYYSILSFVIGAMLYIVIRDLIPKDEEGKPLHFLIGVLLSMLATSLISLF